jgi:hypothetical protein
MNMMLCLAAFFFSCFNVLYHSCVLRSMPRIYDLLLLLLLFLAVTCRALLGVSPKEK